MRQYFARLAFAAVVFAVAHAALAQISAGTKPIYSIEFKPGMKGTVVSGTVSPPRTAGPDMTNSGSERYSLTVRAGQHLTMKIGSSDGQAMFSIVKPSPAGSRNEIVERAGGVRRWSGGLTLTRNYQITVFTHAAEAVSRFKLRITLR